VNSATGACAGDVGSWTATMTATVPQNQRNTSPGPVVT
jgi:hypothetical protein